MIVFFNCIHCKQLKYGSISNHIKLHNKELALGWIHTLKYYFDMKRLQIFITSAREIKIFFCTMQHKHRQLKFLAVTQRPTAWLSHKTKFGKVEKHKYLYNLCFDMTTSTFC